MFDLFKRNNATSEITRKSVFPPAEEMAAESMQKWPELTAEKIVKWIYEESANGKRYVSFSNTTISEENKKELKKQGYRVEQGECYGAPLVEIFW